MGKVDTIVQWWGESTEAEHASGVPDFSAMPDTVRTAKDLDPSIALLKRLENQGAPREARKIRSILEDVRHELEAGRKFGPSIPQGMVDVLLQHSDALMNYAAREWGEQAERAMQDWLVGLGQQLEDFTR